MSPNRTDKDNVRVALLAAMETGNQSRARTVLNEFADTHPEEAEALRMEVIEAYGYHL